MSNHPSRSRRKRNALRFRLYAADGRILGVYSRRYLAEREQALHNGSVLKVEGGSGGREMTDHMSLLHWTHEQLDAELERDNPSEAVIVACRIAIKKLEDGGHAKTFAEMSQPNDD